MHDFHSKDNDNIKVKYIVDSISANAIQIKFYSDVFNIHVIIVIWNEMNLILRDVFVNKIVSNVIDFQFRISVYHTFVCSIENVSNLFIVAKKEFAICFDVFVYMSYA